MKSSQQSSQLNKENSHHFKEFSLSKKGLEIVQKEMTRYETKLSCVIPCLWQIQKEKGWISKSAVSWLSQITQIPESHIFEVLMFYTMFNKQPVGKYHIQVCTNVSCALKGSRELVDELCKNLKVKENEKSVCGTWTVSRVECLGACDEAPVIQLNDEYLGKIKKEDMLSFLKSKAE
ncbi:MAG: NAD(P)H-dependent oxidoreductase subunit E [Bdellovibrionales bacterium]|nr:NAD(P)H-dependent oxidoreductase subunit E [Bdellovibrionales bacterium]